MGALICRTCEALVANLEMSQTLHSLWPDEESTEDLSLAQQELKGHQVHCPVHRNQMADVWKTIHARLGSLG